MQLSDNELRDILERAEEIQLATRNRNELSAEVEGLIEAAAAVGLGRAAVERALRERLDFSMTPPAAGSETAPSTSSTTSGCSLTAIRRTAERAVEVEVTPQA